jgi:hypothetical protein
LLCVEGNPVIELPQYKKRHFIVKYQNAVSRLFQWLRAVRSQLLNVPQAHAGGNNAECGTDLESAGGPGEAGFMIDDRY